MPSKPRTITRLPSASGSSRGSLHPTDSPTATAMTTVTRTNAARRRQAASRRSRADADAPRTWQSQCPGIPRRRYRPQHASGAPRRRFAECSCLALRAVPAGERIAVEQRLALHVVLRFRPNSFSTVGAISTSVGSFSSMALLQKRMPGTRRGSTQWSPLQALTLSSNTLPMMTPDVQSQEWR